MDPIMLSGAFATIVGLLANFKSERSGVALTDFISWLQEQHQDQVLAQIASDEKLTQELKVLLAVKHDELVARLSALNEQIAQVGMQIEGFSALATHLATPSPLSDQALSIIKQLVTSGADFAMDSGMGTYTIVGGTGNDLIVEEPKFFNEDIEVLQSAGLLRVEFGSRGSRKLIPSRLGVQYVRRRDA